MKDRECNRCLAPEYEHDHETDKTLGHILALALLLRPWYNLESDPRSGWRRRGVFGKQVFVLPYSNSFFPTFNVPDVVADPEPRLCDRGTPHPIGAPPVVSGCLGTPLDLSLVSGA